MSVPRLTGRCRKYKGGVIPWHNPVTIYETRDGWVVPVGEKCCGCGKEAT